MAGRAEAWLGILDGGQGASLQATLVEQHVGKEKTLGAVALDLGPFDSHVKTRRGLGFSTSRLRTFSYQLNLYPKSSLIIINW